QDDDLPHPDGGRGLEVVVEVLSANGLEVDEVVAELALQRVLGRLAVEQVGPLSPNGPAEDLGEWIDRRGVGLLRLECSRRCYEERGRSDARCDVPGVIFGTHVRVSTPGF